MAPSHQEQTINTEIITILYEYNNNWVEVLKNGISKICGAFKEFEVIWSAQANHITSNLLKAVFHKFYLNHSCLPGPKSSLNQFRNKAVNLTVRFFVFLYFSSYNLQVIFADVFRSIYFILKGVRTLLFSKAAALGNSNFPREETL